ANAGETGADASGRPRRRRARYPGVLLLFHDTPVHRGHAGPLQRCRSLRQQQDRHQPREASRPARAEARRRAAPGAGAEHAPRREVFSRETQEPSASIVLMLRAPIARQQVAAIQSLVAAAIPKMSPAQVSVIDDKGNLLAKVSEEADALGFSASTAEELRRAR